MKKSLANLRPTSLQPFTLDKSQCSEPVKMELKNEPQQQPQSLKSKLTAAKLSHLSFGAGLQLQPLNSFAPSQRDSQPYNFQEP